MRYFLRKADAADDFRITVADSSTTERALDTFVGFWTAQWEAKSPRYARSLLGNCRAMLPPCFQAGRLFVPVLWQGDVPIGVHVAFIDREKRSLVCFLVGRDTSVRKPPPGFVLHAFSIRWAIENGFRTYDLGTGDFSYKYRFGSKERLVEGVRVRTKDGTNLGGRLDLRSLPAALSWIRRLLAEGRFDLAAIGCKQVLAAAPDNGEAEALLRQVEAAAASSLALRVARANEMQRTGQLRQAAKIYLDVLAEYPRHFEASYMLGIACLRTGEPAAAETHLRRAVEINPRHAAAHNNHGNALRALRRLDDAHRSYSYAIALKPDFAEAFSNLGIVMSELGRPAEALAHFDRALELNPTLSKAISNRASLLAKLGGRIGQRDQAGGQQETES